MIYVREVRNLLTLYKYDELYQWDTGRALLLSPDSNGNTPTQIEFDYNGVALSVLPKTDDDNQIASIPNICLQESGNLIAYEVINTDGHITYSRYIFIIKPKCMPDGYVYEETEMLNWHELDARIADLDSKKLDKPTNTGSAGQVLIYQSDGTTKWGNVVSTQDSMILNSSTEGSTKQFQITVDDSGTITATELQTGTQ